MIDEGRLIAGEITGWRAWGVRLATPRTPVLYSVTHAVPWPSDTWMVADCRYDHHPPAANCSCGIYAARDRSQLDDLGYADDYMLRVIGEVGLAGRVVTGTQGWRAEKARVLRLWVPFEHWEFVELLNDTYRVPVGLANTLGPEEIPRWT